MNIFFKLKYNKFYTWIVSAHGNRKMYIVILGINKDTLKTLNQK